MKTKHLLILLVALFFFITLGCITIFFGVKTLASNFVSTITVYQTQGTTSTLAAVTHESTLQPTQALPLSNSTPVPSLGEDTPKATGTIREDPLNDLQRNLQVFETSQVPIYDPFDLAIRLTGQDILPRQMDGAPILYQTGDQQIFYVVDNDTNEIFQVQATMQYETEHVYFWIDNRVNSYSKKDLQKLVETFENQIYQTTRAFFGSEWSPGVDNDPHLYILYTKDIGSSVAGYFSSIDSYLPIVREYSNAHEMFILSADILELDDDYTYGVLAHEFQHMIHWNVDRNEDTWLNEGFSNLAMLVNGYSAGSPERTYLQSPDLQLNYWSPNPSENTPHYGASFLFAAYLLDRFGTKITQALVSHPANGLASLDQVLDDQAIIDSETGEKLLADEIFRDWAIANWLQNEEISGDRYNIPSLPNLLLPSKIETDGKCPSSVVNQQVSQYGVDYISFQCKTNLKLNFDGISQVPVLDTEPHSGAFSFYSNTGDESDMTLTRQFDFSQHNGPVTFSYWTWFDIEKDYDYLYLMASLDGKTWQILTTPSGTPNNPNGNSYGWAYNGKSGNSQGSGEPQWIQESVDLSAYAGEKVYLRFEYITDAAVYGEGLLLDDISIAETGYFTDFEQDDGGWQAAGFVRIQNWLPQKFIVSLIQIGDEITITPLTLDADNNISIPIQFGRDIEEVVLVISGANRFTRQKASYQVTILQD